MITPYLIQRMEENKYPDDSKKKGIDKIVKFDYMGSSEFEFGALFRALKDLRSQKENLVVEKIEVQTNNQKHSCFFVGTISVIEHAREFFLGQLTDPFKTRLKAQTHIQEVYIQSSEKHFSKRRSQKDIFVVRSTVEAWWALDAELVPWAIFKREELAKKWLDAVRNG